MRAMKLEIGVVPIGRIERICSHIHSMKKFGLRLPTAPFSWETWRVSYFASANFFVKNPTMPSYSSRLVADMRGATIF